MLRRFKYVARRDTENLEKGVLSSKTSGMRGSSSVPSRYSDTIYEQISFVMSIAREGQNCDR